VGICILHFDDDISAIPASPWEKTGDTLRWDVDGTIYTGLDIPTHTLGAGDGIVTITSTDGWAGVTDIVLNYEDTSIPWTGPFPNLKNLDLDIFDRLIVNNCDLEYDLSSLDGLSTLTYVSAAQMDTATGDIGDLADMVNMYIFTPRGSPNITGDISVIAGWNDTLAVCYLNDTSIYGDIAAFADKTIFLLSCDNCVGVYGDLADLTNSTFWDLHLESTSISGNISAFSGITDINEIRLSYTDAEGDLSSLVGLSSLDHLYLRDTVIEGDFGPVVSGMYNDPNVQSTHIYLTGCANVYGNTDAFLSNTNFGSLSLVGTQAEGELSDFNTQINLTQLYLNGVTGITGDLSDLTPNNDLLYLTLSNNPNITGDVGDLTGNFRQLYLQNTSITDVTSQFVNRYLIDLNLSNNSLDSDAIDQVIYNYYLIRNTLFLTSYYTINLQNTAIPSATGLSYKTTLENLNWSGAGGINIIVDS